MSIYLWILIGACVLAVIVSVVYTLVSMEKTRKEIEEHFSKEKLLQYEAELAKLLEEQKIDDSRDIRSIVEDLDYTIEETDKLPFYKEAQFDPDKKLIQIRDDFDIMQQNFDIAHELTHILRKDAAAAKTSVSFLKRKTIAEQITDYMAAAILVPADELVEKMQKHNYHEMKKEEKARFREKVSLEKDVHISVVRRRIMEVIRMGKYQTVTE